MNFSKNILVFGVGNGISKFLQVLLVPLFVRVFSIEEYGIYDIIYTIQSLAFLLGMIQLESFISRFYFDKEIASKKKLISTCVTLLIIISLIITLLFISLSNVGAVRLGDSGFQSTIIIAAMCIVPTNLYYFFTMLLRLENRPMLFLKINILQVVLNLSLALLLILYLKTGIVGIFIAVLVTNTAISSILLFIYHWDIRLIVDHATLRKIKGFCLPGVPAVLISWSNNYTNRFVILYYLSTAQVGVFSSAMKLTAIFVMIDITLRMSWVPFFWHNFNRLDHRDLFKSKFKQIISGLLVLLLFFIFFGDPLFRVFTPSEYWQGNSIIEILGLTFFVNAISNFVVMGPDIVKKTKYLSYLSLISFLFNVFFLVLLTPKYGIIGAAVALFCSNVIFLIMSWWISEKLYYVGYKVKYFLIRMSPILCFSLFFQNQYGTFYHRLLLFIPIFLLYLVVFERQNIQYLMYRMIK